MNARRLKSIPLFSGLDKRELNRVAECAEELEVGAGEQLLQEGAYAFEFYAIERGAAQAIRDGAHVGDLGPGDVFGELGALSHGQRTASIVATAPTTLILIRAQDFRHFADEMPELGARIREVVAERTHAAGM